MCFKNFHLLSLSSNIFPHMRASISHIALAHGIHGLRRGFLSVPVREPATRARAKLPNHSKLDARPGHPCAWLLLLFLCSVYFCSPHKHDSRATTTDHCTIMRHCVNQCGPRPWRRVARGAPRPLDRPPPLLRTLLMAASRGEVPARATGRGRRGSRPRRSALGLRELRANGGQARVRWAVRARRCAGCGLRPPWERAASRACSAGGSSRAAGVPAGLGRIGGVREQQVLLLAGECWMGAGLKSPSRPCAPGVADGERGVLGPLL